MSTLALCIPAYNAAGVLPRLLKSAANQVIPFDEILVYDDCSNDNTGELAREFGATVIRGYVNAGCSTGKNSLAAVAKSDWLHFHDADDDLLPVFTKVAHRWMAENFSPDIILMHYQYRNFETGELYFEPAYSIEEIKTDPVKFTIVNKVVNFALLRKQAFLNVGGFDTNPLVLYNEDRAFYTRAAINGLTFGYEPELTCINYYYPGSMSANNKSKCARAVYNVWLNVINKTGKKYSEAIAAQLLFNALFAATASDWEITGKSVTKAKEIYPEIIPDGSKIFRWLFRIIPVSSFVIRELLIRNFKRK